MNSGAQNTDLQVNNSSNLAITVIVYHRLQLFGFLIISFQIPFVWFFHYSPFPVLAVEHKLEDAKGATHQIRRLPGVQ